jgi:hypothetical protein
MKKILYIMSLMMLPAMFAKAQTGATGKQITITKLIAYEKENRVFIEWSATGGNEINYWEVQGSPDGQRFSTLALVLGPDPAGTGEYFAFKEKITKRSAVYYRLVLVSTSGERVQSEILKPGNTPSSLVSPTVGVNIQVQ